MEGNEWYCAFRLASGLPVYSDPNAIGFIPHPYPPLHAWLGAALVKLFGPELWAARLVSVLFMTMTSALIARAVWQRTRSRAAVSLGACMFLGLWGVLDTWYDLIRGDIAYVALTMAAFTVWAERPASARHAAGALALLAVASLAKQLAAIVLLFASIHCLMALRRPLIASIGLILCVAFYATLHAATDGWSTFWIWELPRRHPLEWQRFFPGGIARAAWIAALPLAVVGLVAFANRRTPVRGRLDAWREFGVASIWGTALLAAFVAGALTYSKVGSGINNWMLFAAVTCVLSASAFGRLQSMPEARRGARLLAAGLLVAQAALCVYDPRDKIPSGADRTAGDALVETIRQIPGDVHVLDDAYLAHRAGKNPYIGGMALGDLAYAGLPPPDALMQRIQRREFTALVLRYDPTDPKHTQPVPVAIRAAYTGRKLQIAYAAEDDFMPVAGGRYKPRWIVFAPDSTH
jgi:hypothetical protein